MTRALIVVDVQNDFCEGGSLAVSGGHDVAARITDHLAEHAARYAAVVATRDAHEAHSSNGGHFAEPGAQPDYATTWPVHCVAGTEGHAYAPGLDTTHVTHHVVKGAGVPAYSGFEGSLETEHGTDDTDDTDDTDLATLLAGLGVDEVDVVGLATDHCVRATVLDARRHGLGVRLLDGMHAGVAPDTTEAALAEMRAAGAVLG